MFERFTDRARRVVVLAQEEARMLNHNYIGTEHLLLGLIHEGDGVAARALKALDISLEAVRREVEEIVGQGDQPQSGHIPFTPRAKKVLELSLREANQLGHNYIGTEHILLGLIREGDGVAAQVLVRLGADLNRTRQQVLQLLHGSQGREPGAGVLWSRLSGRGGRLDELGGKLDAIADRLAAIEHRLGIGPGPKPEALRQLERRIDEIRAQKEEAIDAMNFERAAALRDTEKQLLTEKDAAEKEWLAAREQGTGSGGSAPPLAEGAAEPQPSAASADPAQSERLRHEVERLRDLLRRHDIDPNADPPPGAAAGA